MIAPSGHAKTSTDGRLDRPAEISLRLRQTLMACGLERCCIRRNWPEPEYRRPVYHSRVSEGTIGREGA